MSNLVQSLFRLRSLVLAGLVAVVAVLLVWTLAKQSHFMAASSIEQALPPSPPPGLVSDAQGRPSLISGGTGSRMRTIPHATDGNAPSLLGGTPDMSKVRAEQERMAAELERAHRAEAVDPVWAGKAEPALNELARSDVVAESGIRPQAFKSDCRSSTCRISASFDSSSDAEMWSMVLAAGTGKTFRQTRTAVVPLGNGKFEVRIYGVRR